jgi:hypothetical protein
MKAYGYIYIHKNKKNSHVYIGQSTQPPERRFRKGAKALNTYKSCPAMYAALQKYGWKGFKTEILVWAKTQEMLNLLEEIYINEYGSADGTHGYNTVSFSQGRGKQAESTKEKIRQRQLEFNKKQKEMGIIKIAPNKKEHIFVDEIECKICNTCQIAKPLEEYNKYTTTWDKLHRYCKICQRIHRKEQYSKDRTPLTLEELKQSYVYRTHSMSAGIKKKYEEDPQYRLKNSKAKRKAIIRIDPNTGEQKEYDSGLAAKADGFDNTYVSGACKKGTIFKGFYWKFKNN